MEMNLSRMAPLRASAVRYIVVHTADFAGRDCDAEMINGWHVRERGWPGIGYHFVVLNDRHASLPDGLVQPGRPLHKRGAHVKGINHMSVGICCVGKGDRQALTPAQLGSLAKLIAGLMDRYDVPLDRVIGHRDVNRLIDDGIVRERDSKGESNRTDKTCPGLKVDMETIRQRVEAERADPLDRVFPLPQIVVSRRARPAAPGIIGEVALPSPSA